MTNLTEKWKNWQLKGFKWYYVKFKTGEIDICWLTEWSNDELGTGGQYFDGIKDENILEVLAEVPSYEQWKMVYKTEFKLLEQVVKLKELLHENRQKMFEAEKNYGFDDSIIDILTPQMDKIDKLLGDKTDD